MAALEITSAIATRTLTLAATVLVIEVAPEVAGQISGIYLTCGSDVYYQILANGGALAEGSVAPTVDINYIATGLPTPVPIPAHASGLTSGQPYRIAVWATAGSPTLYVAPYAVTR